MNKLGDFLKPESMLTVNVVGTTIAGIGAAFEQTLHVPNGYIMLLFALLFGIIMATTSAKPGQGKAIFIVYVLLGMGLGMYEAVQSGTFIDSKVQPVSASEIDTVFVDRGGMYVASRVTDQGVDVHKAPAWAVRMYCEHIRDEVEQIQKQSPWKIKF